MRSAIKRRRPALKPDFKYSSVWVTQFINKAMVRGQKQTAASAVYKALEEAAKKLKKEPLEIFEQAIKNVSPQVEVRPKRVGGATYQVPMEVRTYRKVALAMRWIINAARDKAGKPFEVKLAEEIMSAFNNEGDAIRKRDTMHRMAEANKAFAHYARF